MDAKTLYSVALIGCGRVALKHLKAISHNQKHVQLSAVVDTKPAKAKEVLAKHYKGQPNSVQLYTDVEQMLADEKPDIAAITTPSGTHYELAKEMILNRIHVFIEKPMTLNLGEARELVALAEENQVQIIMGHIYRYLPLVDLIHNDIASGRLGTVYSGDVKVRWGHDQEYYDLADWRGTWAQDGGALMNQTVHAVDLMCWLLDDEPIKVSGLISQASHNIEAEDHGAAIMQMSEGGICLVEGTTNNSPENQSAAFHIITEEMEIEAGIRRGKFYFRLTDYKGKNVTRKYYWRFFQQMRKRGILCSLREMFNPHTAIYTDLIDCIDNNSTPRADGNSGVQSVESIFAIYQSALKNGEPVSIPLDDFKLEDMTGFFSD